MSDYIRKETTPSGFTVEVFYDPHPDNPCTEWDQLGTVALDKRSRYSFGNERLDSARLQEIGTSEDYVKLPIYIYDHSGITINTTGFSCSWDSGCVGLIYVHKDKLYQEYDTKRITPKLRERVLTTLRGEIEDLDRYLTGQVYGWRVLDPEGNDLESCYGYFGTVDDCLQEGLCVAKHYEEEALEERRQNWRKALREAREARYWATRDVATA
jgi:hypothetical protein